MLPRAIIVLPALVLVCGKLLLAGQQPYPNDPNAKVLSLDTRDSEGPPLLDITSKKDAIPSGSKPASARADMPIRSAS